MFVLAVGAERIVELAVSKRNLGWAFSRGGREYGRGHYPAMVLLHFALLVGCIAEVWLFDRPFLPVLGWAMVVVVLAAQSLRWWCISTLGRRWNTLIVVVPGLPLVDRGPYRWLRHPNYVAVVAEGIALPMVHTAWVTAITFTVLNAVLLRVRIRAEEAALAEALAAPPAVAGPEPFRPVPGQHGSVQRESVQRESVQREPAQREPAQREPAQREPAQREPAQREPAKRDPAQRDPAQREAQSGP